MGQLILEATPLRGDVGGEADTRRKDLPQPGDFSFRAGLLPIPTTLWRAAAPIV